MTYARAHATCLLFRLAPTLALVLLVTFVQGCSITQPGGRAGDSAELTRNRQRWASAQLHDYEYDYQLICFCAPDATEPVHIVVRSDVVTSVVRRRDGLPAGTPYNGWPRVDDLFDRVARALDSDVARLDVTYDPTYGYPREIVIDIEAMAVDDESQQTAGNLRPLR